MPEIFLLANTYYFTPFIQSSRTHCFITVVPHHGKTKDVLARIGHDKRGKKDTEGKLWGGGTYESLKPNVAFAWLGVIQREIFDPLVKLAADEVVIPENEHLFETESGGDNVPRKLVSRESTSA